MRVGAAEQIVGRERNQRACLRQLVRNAVVSRPLKRGVRRHSILKQAKVKGAEAADEQSSY